MRLPQIPKPRMTDEFQETGTLQSPVVEIFSFSLSFFFLYFLFCSKTKPGLFLTRFHFFQAVAHGSCLFQAISFSFVSGSCSFAPQKSAAVGKVFVPINDPLKIETQIGQMSCQLLDIFRRRNLSSYPYYAIRRPVQEDASSFCYRKSQFDQAW